MSGEGVGKRGHKGLIIGIIAIVVILVILLIPMIPTTEDYSVTEPFERKATYVVENWDLNEKLGFFDVYVQSDVRVRNTDKYSGTFQVIHKLYDIDGLFGTMTDSFYLDAGGSHTSTATFDTRWGQDTRGTYSITSPTVVDERLVTKHRTIYKSIIELLFYR